MTDENYCAERLRLLEGEYFIGVGDARVAAVLNPRHREDRREGKGEPLPDLLSVKKADGKTLFRLREVKFRLEERLVAKAIRQLQSGAAHLRSKSRAPEIDRLEIVIPLRGRKLKPGELGFIGEQISLSRFELRFPEARKSGITVLLL